jgi:hypothetical protein
MDPSFGGMGMGIRKRIFPFCVPLYEYILKDAPYCEMPIKTQQLQLHIYTRRTEITWMIPNERVKSLYAINLATQ